MSLNVKELDEALTEIGLPPKFELLGSKFCYISDEPDDHAIGDLLILGIIGRIEFSRDLYLQIFPQLISVGNYELLSFTFEDDGKAPIDDSQPSKKCTAWFTREKGDESMLGMNGTIIIQT